jgi:ubiquinone/menaquinone biosynthesis C-methylase UbiE
MKTMTFREIELAAWTQRAGEYDHIFAPVSTQAIDDILDNLGPLQGMHHLDVACGTGHLVRAASERGAASEGVDFAPAMLEAARANYPAERFQTADAVDLPYENGTFDVVSCAFGLSHMQDPQSAVDEVFRVLKPGGRFVFTLWYGEEAGNQLQAIVKSALRTHATVDFNLPDQWVQLRYADEIACAAITRQAGFERPAFKKLPIVWTASTAQEVVNNLKKLSLRNKTIIDSQPSEVQARIYAHILGSVESQRSNGTIPLAWPALLAVVQKPLRSAVAKPLNQVVEKYKLYDSLEEMLSPETLSELLSEPVSSLKIRPITDHGGVAGGRLYYVETDAGRFVLKRMSLEHDYLMFTSDDRRGRAVRLWQYGLLDELRPEIEHKIIACARDGDGWGILMHDLSDGLFGGEDHTMPPRLVEVFLDRLARLHARFWNDPRLLDPRVGLSDATNRLRITSLKLAQQQNGDQRGVVPTWVREGWEILEAILEPDAFLQMRHLNENPKPLFEALKRYPYTLVHSDYRQANLAFLEPDQAVVFDWHWASHGLMTVDLAWFTGGDYVQNSIGKVEAIRYYRDKLETYLGTIFAEDIWQAMLGLGDLVDALTICFPAYWSKHAEKPEWRDYFLRSVKECIQQMHNGLRWL